MIRFITTIAYVGRAPFAPGTFGSVVAIPLAYLLHRTTGFPGLLTATIAMFLVGWWATAQATRGQDNHDPSEIVIDEVVGQWIALMPLSAGLWHAGVDPAVFPYPGWVLAFALFRLFDITKPWIVGRADRMATPLGVMLDDVLAGVMAGVIVGAAGGLFHSVFS